MNSTEKRSISMALVVVVAIGLYLWFGYIGWWALYVIAGGIGLYFEDYSKSGSSSNLDIPELLNNLPTESSNATSPDDEGDADLATGEWDDLIE